MSQEWTDPALFGRATMPAKEELRFFRLIEERDGPLITLACGHLKRMEPAESQHYALCETCQRNFSEREKEMKT